MKDFADLTNNNIPDARAQWKDLSSRLMGLPRLPSKSPSPEQRDESEEIIEDCIIVKDESAADDADERDEEDGRKAEPKVKTKRKGKQKQVAKPSVLDNIEINSEFENSVRPSNDTHAGSSENEAAEPSTREDRIKKAWDNIGDDM